MRRHQTQRDSRVPDQACLRGSVPVQTDIVRYRARHLGLCVSLRLCLAATGHSRPGLEGLGSLNPVFMERHRAVIALLNDRQL